jgi:serine/threonine protein kinase/tetratricopeptide (TPR) repeat protein
VTRKVDIFLDCVRKSEIIEPQRLQGYLDRLKTESPLGDDPTELAQRMVRDGLLSRLHAQQFLSGKFRGFIINGKYKVLELIGCGGMGKVFLAEHILMKRPVAIKVLNVDKGHQPAALERFYREARAIVSLNHPNIVRAFDLDRDSKQHYIVMEYVDGSNLHDMVQTKGPMDPLRAAHYIAQAAAGLQHAHEAGWIHRDIKPGNLLVDRHGVVRVLDLGLARVFNDKVDMLTQRMDNFGPLGTADFVSPEQAMNSSAVDIRADIYSLGATFYFLLTGHPPFPDGTMAQKLMAHQVLDPKPIEDSRPDVPAEMAAIVYRMMEKDPKDRFQMPAEVVEDLALWTETPIPPPPAAEMPKRSSLVSSLVQGSAPASGDGGPSSGGLRPTLSGPLSSRHGQPVSGLRSGASSGSLLALTIRAEGKSSSAGGSSSIELGRASVGHGGIRLPASMSSPFRKRIRWVPGSMILLDRLDRLDIRRRHLVAVLTGALLFLTLAGAIGLTSLRLSAGNDNPQASPPPPVKTGQQLRKEPSPRELVVEEEAPKTAAQLLEEGRDLARRLEWNKAAACYAQMLKIEPRFDGHFWFEYACLLLLSGDPEGYRQTCAHLMEESGKTLKMRTYHLARVCTLVPDPGVDSKRVGEMADAELQASVTQFWSLTQQAALHYRAGRFAEALPLLEESLDVEKKPGRSLLSWLWLAMTYQRMGKVQEARLWLNKATEWMDQFKAGVLRVADRIHGLDLHNWLEAQILRREAEELLGPPPAVKEQRDAKGAPR